MGFRDYHQASSHDRQGPGGLRLDWDDQPSVLKQYPGLDYMALPGPGPEPETPLAEALYPTELYLAASGVEGLADGVYHYAIARRALGLLRAGDHSAWVSRALGRPARSALFMTAIPFRSAWKYGERALRYCMLDVGHLAGSLALAMHACNVACAPGLDFDDQAVHLLLGLDGRREACLAALAVGGGPGQVAFEDVVGPGLAWRPVLEAASAPAMLPWPRAILERRSRRDFAGSILDRDTAAAFLDLLCRRRWKMAARSARPLVLCRSVAGLEDGLYALDTVASALCLVRPGALMPGLARACLGQAWLERANMHLLFATHLERLEACLGQMGYRAAHVQAGAMGQLAYVAAQALGLGACGVGAFFDAEAAEVLGLESGARLLYLVAVGRLRDRARPE